MPKFNSMSDLHFRPAPLTTLTEDEQMLRDAAADFAREAIAPHVHDMDQQALLRPDIIRGCFEQGLMGIEIPEEYDGAGGSFFMSILAIEEISRVDPAVGVFVDVHNTLVINAFNHWGSDDLKKRCLPRLAADTVGAYALSEAGSGSDAFALKLRAEKKGDRWVLNGHKLWITNGKEAGIFIVFATVNPEDGYKGITAFIVEPGMPGFTIGKKEDKLGIRASSTTELIFEDCEVPVGNVLGEVGKGYKIAIETLNEGRIGIGAQMVGIARGAFDAALGYAQERKQFGKSISSFQGMQFELARLATDIELARLLVYQAARLKESGQPFLKEAAMAKFYSSEVAERVASSAVEIFGGYGYVKEYPVEKFYRDAKIGKIYEGTTFMQLQTIAKLLMK
ncbi:MAG: putative acyl-CoA dehydrogenase [Bacteroidetes bacterium HLUCCA01]|nr:MAG: putative acyl-CoA dehydrogenase [Bacteroidetes bacterium HLUCCA01]